MHPHIPGLGHLVGQLIILLVVASNQNLIQQPCVSIARQQTQQAQIRAHSTLVPQQSDAMLDHCIHWLRQTPVCSDGGTPGGGGGGAGAGAGVQGGGSLMPMQGSNQPRGR